MTDLVAFEERRIALAFSDYLRVVGIDNRLEERADRFALVLADPLQLPRAQQELEAFVANPGDSKYLRASWQAGHVQEKPLERNGHSLRTALRAYLTRSGPVTSLVAMICVVVFMGELQDDRVIDLLLFPSGLSAAAIDHEWWRLLTPAFLHFSLLHIAFNLLWWWELGGLIERTQSSAQLLGVALVTAVVGNVAQFLTYGPHFGGLSAVVYGLLGYIWLYPKANPAVGFRLRKEIVWLMLGWIVIGYTGLLDYIAGGKVSNNGHLMGLIAGGVLGLAFGLANRGRAGNPPA